MASEAKILEAIFGPQIPIEKAGVLPEIMGHIKAIDDLLQGKPRPQARLRISDPAISQPINARIGELYTDLSASESTGSIWPKIAAAISQEFNVQISPDACRVRHKDTMARKEAATRQEAYAALSGQAIDKPDHNADANKLIRTSPEPEKLPTGIPTNCPNAATLRNDAAMNVHEPLNVAKDGRQEDKSGNPAQEVQIEAMKAEVIKLYQGGRDVGSIAKQLDILESWVRKVCKDIPPTGVPERNSPASPDSSPKDDPAPLKEAEIDSELIRLRDTGMSPKEIRDAMLQRGVDFGLAELRDRLSALARKALQDRKDSRAASDPEIPASCNRVELDAVMWQLWDHGKGKTPDEISDILCKNGYSYGAAMVERRLRQQGAEF